MSKWIKALIHLGEYGTVGTCPFCKSNNTHYGYEVTKTGERAYGAVWCSDCNHGMYLCRVNMEEVTELGEPIPKGLI